ncbi:MAG: hypothetical protein LBD62_04405 [Candidatus Margulisbacteria bacterium]|jgi:hypothetical protein|nr:hypothetical protein [Candidatus Margulisiibacteriota bacterium]
MIKKEFDCLEFKDRLYANLRKKTAGMNADQYIAFIHSEAQKYEVSMGKAK